MSVSYEQRECPSSQATTQQRLVFTNHAAARLKQRTFSLAELEYVLEYGRILRRNRLSFYFLAARDVPKPQRKLAWGQKLVGTAVLTTQATELESERLITVYKNPKALRQLTRQGGFYRVA